MKRADFQKLSRLRINEAKVLLNANEYSGAYYLSGYGLECAFKSCIAKSYSRHVFPDKAKVNKSHTHNLELLMKVARLEPQFGLDSETNPVLRANWATAKDWNETSRYEIKTEIEAKNLYLAITQRNNGVLKWIQQYW